MSGESQARLTRPVDEQDHIRGSLNAPVLLVEFGDYECVYCRQVHPILRELRQRLGERLGYVFRHFPIEGVHPQARQAALAAEAAAAQGKFWEMHNLLFEHRAPLSDDVLIGFARQLELDLGKFESDLASEELHQRLQEDFRQGALSGVNGTPTFFINGLRYDGPWDLESLLEAIEKPLGVQIRLLASEFASLAASGGIVLIVGTLLALILANSNLAQDFYHIWETPLSISWGELSLSEHLVGWVNDGLMAVFFFVVGLEIKREVTTGELASFKRAALPVAGALGGMLFPALLYLAFNPGAPGNSGWGIPMATDIAFTLGILTLLGPRVPLSLRVFFAALAIADDLGAVLVIALFYNEEIILLALIVAAFFFLGLIGLNRARVYSPLPYAILGFGMWLAMLESGVHPTLAGVLLAMTIPTRGPANTRALMAQCVTVLDDFEPHPELQTGPGSRHQAAVQTLETITERLQSPAQRLERSLHPWSTYLILPLFATANAGVTLKLDSQGLANLTAPISLGILVGLVIGKPLGISLLTYLAVRIGVAELPSGVQWRQLIASSFLAGIGFTMSLFIANSAFSDPAALTTAKLGIFLASILAALIGGGLLWMTSSRFERTTTMEELIVIQS